MRNRAESRNPTLTIDIRPAAINRYLPYPSRADGEAKDVERVIRDAARGSIMQLAGMTDAQAGEPLAINPECVVMLRART